MSDDKENRFDKSLPNHLFNDQLDKNTFTCIVGDSRPDKRFMKQIDQLDKNIPTNEKKKPAENTPNNDKSNKK